MWYNFNADTYDLPIGYYYVQRFLCYDLQGTQISYHISQISVLAYILFTQ